MIQIFGTKKCNATAKALRFFKERGINIQFVNLSEKGLSKGELLSIAKYININDLLNTDSREYKRLNLKYMKFDLEETLLTYPLILMTPIIRSQKFVSIGYKPESWAEIAYQNK